MSECLDNILDLFVSSSINRPAKIFYYKLHTHIYYILYREVALPVSQLKLANF